MRDAGQKYDLSFAVNVRRILGFQKEKNNDYLDEHVWQPTKRFLENLARTRPRRVTCFFSAQFNFPKEDGCKCRHLFLINGNNEVMYAGTVFNPKAIAADIERYVQDAPNALLPEMLPWLQYPEKIRRDPSFIIIPARKEEVDNEEMTIALKKYFRSWGKSIPALANAEICFLSKKEGRKLSEEIRLTAKAQADAKE